MSAPQLSLSLSLSLPLSFSFSVFLSHMSTHLLDITVAHILNAGNLLYFITQIAYFFIKRILTFLEKIGIFFLIQKIDP